MGTDGVEVSPTRRRLLETLKRHGEATAEELAEHLETSPSAVRQHLAALRSAGFVTTRPTRGHIGRPADIYRCTSLTDPLFAGQHDLAVQFLDDIHDEDPELVERVFERRRRRMVEATSSGLDGTPTIERVAAVTSQLDALGYLADFEEASDGTFVINLHNCPISAVAERYQHACTAELGFITELLPDADVTRTMHKSAECGTCAYQVSPIPHDQAHRC